MPDHPVSPAPARAAAVSSSFEDGLPEHTPYRDTGCDLAPQCLACPLPACRYDLPHKRAGVLLQQVALRPLLSQGLTINEMAGQLGVSRRTVLRLKLSLERPDGNSLPAT